MLARRDSAVGNLGAGAVAGTLATGLMSAVMVGAKRSGLMGQMPPETITPEQTIESYAAPDRPGSSRTSLS